MCNIKLRGNGTGNTSITSTLGVAEQIAPYINCSFVALGTDGFGRSETRDALRKFFEVNRYYIVMTALESLSNEGKVKKSKVKDAISKYKLDPEKPNPVTV